MGAVRPLSTLNLSQASPRSALLAVRRCSNKVPIVFDKGYDISFFGLERVHPFDCAKWGHIAECLVARGALTAEQFVRPPPPTPDDLEAAHTREYLQSLDSSWVVASIAEVPFLALMPQCLLVPKFMDPLRLQAAGSVVAAMLALDVGWAINLGGGFHHASATQGGGFCVYDDIGMIVVFLRSLGLARRVFVVDVDAHQGNGYERDFAGDDSVYILDQFNEEIYPNDGPARASITNAVPMRCGDGDNKHLPRLRQALALAESQFVVGAGAGADLLIYNSGTDSLAGDALGRMDVSAAGIGLRDEMVFAFARRHSIPIVMLTSGGYQQNNARIIADSILRLAALGLISLPGIKADPGA